MSILTENTTFSRDVMGRYVCNTLGEALASADQGIRPDARPFDVIILGGGTIGAAVAQHLFAADKSHKHRILVLEGGPVLLPEHLQNMPLSGLQIYGPPATSIQELRQAGQFGVDKPRDEVWGLPWHSPTKFPGLAYCLGGRSIAWGGWSPTLLEEELAAWPDAVARELSQRYYKEAGRQLGSRQTNDFIHGELHEAMRSVLFEGIQDGKIGDAVPLDKIPLELEKAPRKRRDQFKLEAPLAVQAETRAGWFPNNKFSPIPLIMQAARAAWGESNHDDVKKRLMVVPNCHVRRLTTVQEGEMQRVVAVETSQGSIPVPEGGAVINALGTIESARLALLSFDGAPNYHLMGRNLMGDMISMLIMRVPRASLPVDETIKDLQTAALLVRGRHEHEDGTVGQFHLQITGSGLGPWDFNAEAEMYRKVPDLDTMAAHRYSDDTHVVIVILGVAKMEPQNEKSFVRLDPEPDEFGEQRAFVQIEASKNDEALWTAMDAASDEVARVFAGGAPYEVFNGKDMTRLEPDQSAAEAMPYPYRHFGLGDSHHEAGALWMGENPQESVVDENGRYHYVSNAYEASPAVFPANAAPVLTGIALGRRLADHLAQPTPYTPEEGFQALFDGVNPAAWTMLGSGGFLVVDGTLESVPGADLGLYWCGVPMPPNYILRLEWLRWQEYDNSGVFVRFPNPYMFGYDNPAYVPVHYGFEIQIDEAGAPDGALKHRTGAIYGVDNQEMVRRQARPPGQWNEFEIRVEGNEFTVDMNGERVTRFENSDPERGQPGSSDQPTYIGLQSYPGSRVAFRHIRFKAL